MFVDWSGQLFGYAVLARSPDTAELFGEISLAGNFPLENRATKIKITA
jgi:hypothetical protein